MKLQQRIAISVILLSTLGLVLAGGLTHYNTKQTLEQTTIDNLLALAAVQKERLSESIHAQIDRVALISSRTKLRQVFAQVVQADDASQEQRQILERILSDSMVSVDGFKELRLYDSQKKLRLNVKHPRLKETEDAVVEVPQFNRLAVHQIALGPTGELEIQIFERLQLYNTPIGYLAARIEADAFLEIFNNYEGFGETGEALLGRRDMYGNYLFLHDLRFDPHAGLKRHLPASNHDMPMSHAFGDDTKVLLNAVDYSGANVIAVAEPLPELGWGLVVKKSRDEVFARLDDNLTIFIVALLVLIVFFIVASLAVSRSLTRPLSNLTDMARRVADGDYSVRADVNTSDELGLFAKLFNTMLDSTQNFHSELDARVRERTEALEQSRADAQEANRAKSQFLAAMSHEVRTPMNAVLGMSEMLQNTSLNHQQREQVRIIRESGQSLLDLINQILDFSKIESQQLLLETIPFNLHESLYEAVRVNASNADTKVLDLVVDYPSELPHFFHGDPTRLKQIFINLIGNAVKFTNEGYVILRVRAEQEAACFDGGEVVNLEFSVEDSGTGISKEALLNLFEPFTQADASTTRKYGGTGLGLAISRRLAELMGGRLFAQSEQGSGSCFTLKLPLKVAEPFEADQDAGDNQEMSNCKILLVDDTLVNLTVFEQQLLPLGAEVVSVLSGQEAIEAYEKALQDGKPFDVLLTDFAMPSMGGAELVRTLRRQYPDSRLSTLIISASISQVDYEEIEQLGVNVFLSKPVEGFILRRAVHFAREKPDAFWTYSLLSTAAVAFEHDASFSQRVLVVEDIASNRMVAQAMLQPFGVEVVFAENGQEAFERYQEDEFGLVLMDIRMPVVDGYRATEMIRAHEHQNRMGRTPIVALTADITKETAELVSKAGMDDMLSKPIELSDLEKVLSRYLKKDQLG